MIPLLEQLQDQRATTQVPRGMLDGLNTDLRKLEEVAINAKRMHPLVYVMKASSIHDDVVSLLDQMQFSLGALGVLQNVTIHQNLQELQDRWREEMKGFKCIQSEARHQRDDLLLSGTQALYQMTDGNPGEAYKAMKAERKRIKRKMRESANESIRKAKMEQEEGYMTQIIASLVLAEAEATNTAQLIESLEVPGKEDRRRGGLSTSVVHLSHHAGSHD